MSPLEHIPSWEPMVDRATAIPDTFSLVFDILNSNVQSITDSTGSQISLRENNGNYWTGSFPDIEIEDSSEYPIGVIESPDIISMDEGLRWTEDTLTVDIRVYGARAEHPPKFASAALEALRDNLIKLHAAGVYHVEVGNTDHDMRVKGDAKVHFYSMEVDLVFGHKTGL